MTEQAKGQEPTITRVFDAPREQLWKYHQQVGHMPAEQYRAIEQGVNGFYDRLAEQFAR